MNLTIKSDVFASALGRLSGIVSGKVTMPALSSVKLEAADGLLRLTANNLDQSISVSTTAAVKTGGAVLLPAKKLSSIVSDLPRGELSIVMKENSVHLKLGT